MANNPLPLADIRVLEFTHAVMGPAAGLALADMGAEVIRVEPAPHGDHTRRLKGFGTGFHTFFNRNKKSLAVNVKAAEGKEVIQRLLPSVDVLIENFAPGTMERLGFGYEEVAALNPRLVYCRLKGFMEGPYQQRTALDEVVQMMSGLAYMTGPPGQPLRAGASIVDIMSGTFGALGVLAALREREQSGEGRLVTSGLFETAAYIMGQHMAFGAIAQEEVPPMPARVSPWAVYRLFETQDEQKIFVGITSDKHWRAFCEAFARPDLLADESLATNNQRVAARERLHGELEEFFATMTLQEIVRRCEEAGIPFSPIARPEDLFDDPQLNEGDSLVSVSLPDGREARLPQLPLAMNGSRPDLRRNPPEVGQHTRGLLAGLGYSEEEIESLRQADVIVAPS
ncbi:MAG: CaiB/BaiF CoA-transferase family protein [Candidatus Promineifilaceae bacterium]|nr:CaiB/BaiF CoA-transferase family protein [Candidatus Promineifilaceae bacterium]